MNPLYIIYIVPASVGGGFAAIGALLIMFIGMPIGLAVAHAGIQIYLITTLIALCGFIPYLAFQTLGRIPVLGRLARHALALLAMFIAFAFIPPHILLVWRSFKPNPLRGDGFLNLDTTPVLVNPAASFGVMALLGVIVYLVYVLRSKETVQPLKQAATLGIHGALIATVLFAWVEWNRPHASVTWPGILDQVNYWGTETMRRHKAGEHEREWMAAHSMLEEIEALERKTGGWMHLDTLRVAADEELVKFQAEHDAAGLEVMRLPRELHR